LEAGYGNGNFSNITAVGELAMGSQAAIGSSNTAIGYQSLYQSFGINNTAIGYTAGYSITSGTTNTFIGYNSGNNALQNANVANSTAIGYQSYTTASNQMAYGNASITQHIFSGGTIIINNGSLKMIDGNQGTGKVLIDNGSGTGIAKWATIASISSGLTGVTTVVQNGLNTYTGGTQLAPSVNISAATLSTLTVTGATNLTGGLTANTISATSAILINSNSTTTINGTAGNILCNMPFQGIDYKKVMLYLNGFNKASSVRYTFPTAFTYVPTYILGQGATAASLIPTATYVDIVVGTPTTGWVIIEGY
jgi:hypothetical protein